MNDEEKKQEQRNFGVFGIVLGVVGAIIYWLLQHTSAGQGMLQSIQQLFGVNILPVVILLSVAVGAAGAAFYLANQPTKA